MPFDGTEYNKPEHPDFTNFSTPAKLRYLARVMERLPQDQIYMTQWHNECGTAHCAWGWAEQIGMTQRASDYSARNELDLTNEQLIYCFGPGNQFEYLGRRYTPADVARHLRETADQVQYQGFGGKVRKYLARVVGP